MNLPANFLNDIQGKDTSLIPLVIIEHPNLASSDDLYISTNNISVDTWSADNALTSTNKHFQPLLLNIPSIKQSVDIENRRFKISSVTLSISNYEYGGVRFSDLLQTSSMINRTVSIFWKSPQSEIAIPSKFELTAYALGLDFDITCPKIYTGKIRRILHDTDVVTVELEDSTESNAHKDLPQTFLPSDEGVLDKYRNKPIPMVYGHVDRSPLVFSDLYRTLVADSSDIDSFHSRTNIFNETDYSLWVDVGYFINVVKTDQYEEDGSQIKITSTVPEIGIEQETYLKCRDSSNNFQVTLSNKLDDPSLTTDDYDNPDGSVSAIFDGSQDINEINWIASRTISFDDNIEDGYLINDIILLYDSNDGYLNIDFRSVYQVLKENGVQDKVEFLLLTLGFNFFPNYDVVDLNNEGDSVHLIGMTLNETIFSDILPHNYPHSPENGFVIHTNSHPDSNITDLDHDAVGGVSNAYDDYHSLGNLAAYGVGDPSYFFYELINAKFNFINTVWDSDAPSFWGDAGNNVNAPIHFESTFGFAGSEAAVTLNLTTPNLPTSGGLNEISLLREVRATKIFEKDYYVDIRGRTYQGELAQNPAKIIRHILEEELGYTDFDEEDYQEAVYVHEGMKYGFTVHDKQISSKKLIEDIAKSTLMFPHFGNDGKFRFNSLKEYYTDEDIYGSEDVNGALVIPESEVIDYSFSKTKPEQIYSKYEVDYYYDYAQKSYLKKVSDDFSITDDLHLEFYGFEDSDANIGKLESAYIRDEETAKKLNGLLFNYYKNSHLLLKLKLPVKYIGLSVGDTIRFNELLGGMTAYGVDYTVESTPNEQLVYPLFYITSLQKNIDSVSVELIQLHNITYQVEGDATGYVDADPPDRIFTQSDNEQQFKFTFQEGITEYVVGESGAFETDEPLEELFGVQNWYIEYAEGSYSAISVWEDLLPSSATDTFEGTILELWVLSENDEIPVAEVKIGDWFGIGVYQIVFNIIADHSPLTLNNDSVYKLVIPEIDEGITFRYNPPLSIVSSVEEAVYEEPPPLDGDINEDGILNILDVIGVVSHIVGNTTLNDAQLEIADMNEDGIINILDIVLMVETILEGT